MHYASRLILGSMDAAPLKTKSLSYQLMLSNGMIAGVPGRGLFVMMPLGQRVIDKFTRLIESELNALGAQKIAMPILGAKELWEKTGRWERMDAEMMKVTDRLEADFCLQPTAEEMITYCVEKISPLRKKALPLMLYQTTQKFRDEMNPRFGLLRGREFLMNDLYTFDLDQSSAMKTYQDVTDAYDRIFRNHLALPEVYRVQADSGDVGGALSHEYHIPNNCAEDKVAICRSCQNPVKIEGEYSEPSCPSCSEKLDVQESVEVGHTFLLGDKYSAPFAACHTDKRPYYMGCFGLGVTRIVAACIDSLSVSATAMRLPKSIAPYKLGVILPKKYKTADEEKLVNDFLNSINTGNLLGDVLVDDRGDKSYGRRLAEMNKLGVPNIIVIGNATMRSLEENQTPKFEFVRTRVGSDEVEECGLISHDDVMEKLRENC